MFVENTRKVYLHTEKLTTSPQTATRRLPQGTLLPIIYYTSNHPTTSFLGHLLVRQWGQCLQPMILARSMTRSIWISCLVYLDRNSYSEKVYSGLLVIIVYLYKLYAHVSVLGMYLKQSSQPYILISNFSNINFLNIKKCCCDHKNTYFFFHK